MAPPDGAAVSDDAMGLTQRELLMEMRDYPLSAPYASEGLVASVVLPASYASPAIPPVLDQGSSPMCVAFSSSAMKRGRTGGIRSASGQLAEIA
jgi:hypothetical protein